MDPDLEPARIFTPEIELDGFVAPAGQRVTDILLRGQDLAFLPKGAEPEATNWLSVSGADILVVIPPPLPARPDWLSTSIPHDVVVRTGSYTVTGTAHLPRGLAPDGRLVDARPVLPLTSAWIRRDGEPDSSEPADVAIVMLANAASIEPAGQRV